MHGGNPIVIQMGLNSKKRLPVNFMKDVRSQQISPQGLLGGTSNNSPAPPIAANVQVISSKLLQNGRSRAIAQTVLNSNDSDERRQHETDLQMWQQHIQQAVAKKNGPGTSPPRLTLKYVNPTRDVTKNIESGEQPSPLSATFKRSKNKLGRKIERQASKNPTIATLAEDSISQTNASVDQDTDEMGHADGIEQIDNNNGNMVARYKVPSPQKSLLAKPLQQSAQRQSQQDLIGIQGGGASYERRGGGTKRKNKKIIVKQRPLKEPSIPELNLKQS